MKKLILLMLALVIAGLALAQTDITIGTGTSTGRYPFNDFYVYSRSQCIYLESEIGAPGTIHKLRWFRDDTGADANAIGTTQIWLKTVSNAVITDATWEDPGTLVYEVSNIDLGAGNAWYEVDITDFNYTGGNLLVSIYTQNAPYTAPHSYWRYTATTGFNRCRLGNSDSANPPTLSLSTARPNIQINMTTSAPTTAPNPAVLGAPANGAYALMGDILSWSSGGGFPTAYDVYLDTVDGSTLVSNNQAGLTYTPTLVAGTTYYWKVVPSNSFGDATGCPVWSFRTPGATQLIESFENTSFPPAGWANPGSWYRGTTYYKHGTAGAYKSGSTSATYVLSTPKVTITPTSTLNFWAAGSSTTTSILQIVYSADRVTWTQIGSNITPTSTYTMANYNIDLSSLAGNNYYLGFQTGSGAGTNYIDLVIGPDITPEVPGPAGLSTPADLAINVNEYPTFTWTAPTTGGVPTGYAVYCSTSNPPNYTTDLIGSTAGALTFTATTALAYETTYYWTVKAFNAAGDASIPTPRSFTTRANPIVSSFPYAVNFDDVAAPLLPLNWFASEAVAGASQHWKTATADASHGPSAPHSVPNFAYLYCYLASTTYNPYYLTTPPMSLGADAKRLTYWYWIGTDTVAEPLSVEISTDQATWTNLYTHSNTANTLAWYQQVVSLADYANQTVYLRFSGISNYGSNITDLGLDDIVVETIPAAPIFSVAPAAWDFGQTVINTVNTKQFTVANSGGGSLTISNIGISGSYYTLTSNPAPVTLGAGQSATFTVQYAPTVAGTHEGTVTITDNRAVTTVDLDGVCVDPSIYYANLPYTQNFDGVTAPALPFGWAKVGTTGSVYTQTTSPNSAPNCVYIYTPATTLALPPVNMATETALRMKFWARGNYTAGDALIVGYLTNPTDASTFTPIQSVTMAGLTYAQYQVTLGSVTGIKYYAIQAGTLYYSMLIDDVVIEEVPTVPVFSYTPTSINFGSVLQNVAATAQNITITNTGGGTLNIGAADISITGPQSAMFSYVATNLPAALGAGQSVLIPVTVTVTQEGPVSATLTISNSQTRTNYDVDLSATGLPAGIVVIGDGTANNNLPINPFYGYTYSQSIFLQSEINVPDQRIESVYYYWNGVAEAVDSNDWTIYMGHTAATEFASTTDWMPLANLSQVFSGTIALPATAGWIEIPLTAPFIYNNTDNLVIAVDENAPSYDGSSQFFYSTAAATNRSLRYYSDSTNPDPAAPVEGTLVLAYPNVMLELGDIPAGPPEPVTLVSPADGATGMPIEGFNLTWTPAITGGTPTVYGVYLSQDPEDMYNGTYFETTATSLNPATYAEGPGDPIVFNFLDRYYWTVEAVNDEGSAVAEPPFSFQIEDAPQIITTFPWTENFDAALTAPADWTVSDVDGGGTNWVGSTAYAHSTPNAFVHNYSTAVDEPGQNGWLITPAIQVPAGNYYLSWWNYNVYPTWMVYNGVKVNTTDNPSAAGWTELWSQETAASAWSNAVVNISAYAGQTVYFAFNYQGYDGDNWYIDDVSVYELTVDTFGPSITHVPVLNTPREDLPIYVVADIADDATWNNPIGGANMYYSIDGGTNWSAPVAMTLDTAPTYYAQIPPQALGTSVSYYIEAWDSLNNMTTSATFSYDVADPTWIWYDTGTGSYTWFGAGQAFSPIVLFDNPFYGTGNAVQVNAVDGMAYDVNASTSVSATLHVYSWDGVGGIADFVDVSGPIAVVLDHTTYEQFDLSTYNIQIDTPYFVVSYDLPTGAAFLYDGTYDYGTSFANIGGTLYSMSNPGAWSIGANVQTGLSLALDTPVVTIADVAGAPTISWAAVTGANNYVVYGSDDPYAADPWTLVGTTTDLSYSYTGTEGMKFFKVVADSAAPTRNGVTLNKKNIRSLQANAQSLRTPKVLNIQKRNR